MYYFNARFWCNIDFFSLQLDFLPSDETALNVDIKAASIDEQSGASKQAQQQEVSCSSGLNFRLWIWPIEMIWEGCGNRDSVAEKLARWSEKEMLLSMTLLLLLTLAYCIRHSDTGSETSTSVPSQEVAFLSFPVCARTVACLNYGPVPLEFPCAQLFSLLSLSIPAGCSCLPVPCFYGEATDVMRLDCWLMCCKL